MATPAYNMNDDKGPGDDQGFPEIEIYSAEQSGLFNDADISALLSNLKEHHPNAVPVATGPNLERVDLEGIDFVVETYCKRNNIEDVAPFDDDHQAGGMSRIFLGYSTLPAPGATYGRELIEYFVKAALAGDPDVFLDEGDIHQRIAMQTDAVPAVYHVHAINMGTRMVDGVKKNVVLPIIVMEMVHGLSLDNYVEEMKLTRLQKLELVKQYAKKVGEIHQAGYVHRDIKPSNAIVKVERDGKDRIIGGNIDKIVDLGVASEKNELPKNSVVNGTPEFMSPDHMENKTDPRMDIYSIGCVLYQMLTGKAPYTHVVEAKNARPKESDDISPEKVSGQLPIRLYKAMLSEDHISKHSSQVEGALGKLSEELTFIVSHCIKKDPNERFQTCDALVKALDTVIEKERDLQLIYETVNDTLKRGDISGGYEPGNQTDNEEIDEDTAALIDLIGGVLAKSPDPEPGKAVSVPSHFTPRPHDLQGEYSIIKGTETRKEKRRTKLFRIINKE